MDTAFQADAFQNDAFQVAAPAAAGGSRKVSPWTIEYPEPDDEDAIAAIAAALTGPFT